MYIFLTYTERVVSDSTHQKKEQSKETTMKNVKIGEKSAPTNNSTSFKIERQNERYMCFCLLYYAS